MKKWFTQELIIAFLREADADLAISRRWEYNEERPKKALRGLTPSDYMRQPTAEVENINPGP